GRDCAKISSVLTRLLSLHVEVFVNTIHLSAFMGTESAVSPSLDGLLMALLPWMDFATCFLRSTSVNLSPVQFFSSRMTSNCASCCERFCVCRDIPCLRLA